MKKRIHDSKFLIDIIENSLDLIQSVDSEGRILYANQSWKDTLGYTEAEISTLTLKDIIHPDSLDHCMQMFQLLKNVKVLKSVDAVFMTKGGEQVYVNGAVSLAYEKNIPKYTRGIFRNITALKEATEKLELRSKLLDLIADSITLRTADGRLLYANEAAYKSLGYSREEYSELPLKRLTAPPARQLVDDNIQKVLRAGVSIFESVRQRKDGGIINVEVHARIIDTGENKSILSISRDISERKAVEAVLLERTQQLQNANKMKSEFVASMSHDIRTPLNGIIGLSDLILQGTVGEINEELKSCIQDILTSGQHLLTLINDILDMAKVEAGKLDVHIKNVKLIEVVNRVASIIKPTLIEKNQNLVIEIPTDTPLIRADPDRLEQVLSNIMGNAVKFTRNGGKITVKSRLTEGWCQVSVNDDGIGIRKNDLQRIFQPFVQTSSTDLQKKGSGLGLQISKQLIELMGGIIWVESELGKGSTFFFALPVANLV